MSELKPCPFCGGRANVWTNVFGRGTVVYACDNKSCGAEVRFFTGDNKGEAENNELWNRRAIDRDELLNVSEELEIDPFFPGETYCGTLPTEEVMKFEREMAKRIRKAVGE